MNFFALYFLGPFFFTCLFVLSPSLIKGYGLQDCNNDGVTDCMDYMMINHNGGPECTPPLFLSARGRDMISSYKQCVLNA
jgi:hypothetical protein